MFLISMLKRLVIITLTGLLLSIGAIVWWGSSPLNFKGAEIDFRILPGSSVRQAIAKMNGAGLEMNTSLTMLVIRILGIDSKLKAGTYTVSNGATRFDVLEKLKTGDISLIEIRFQEGGRFNQLMQTLAEQPNLEHEISASHTEDEIRKLVGVIEPKLEGVFFPDTYKVDKRSSDIELLQKAYRAQQDRLSSAWKRRADNLPYRNPYEALIMASIIEKETGKAGDRNKVAAVFANRMKVGMRLQTDPTVIYGMGAAYAGNIRKSDLLTDTPYNTYTRSGLPPTPIAMPGAAAIEAALHPADEEIYYFVARGDGSSQFSRTLPEHNAAVAQYQLKH